MDATEPELVGEGTPEALKATMNPTALGSGARMANAFALVSSQAVYEGQRAAKPGQRVFILTRSAFAGSTSSSRTYIVGTPKKSVVRKSSSSSAAVR